MKEQRSVEVNSNSLYLTDAKKDAIKADDTLAKLKEKK